MRAIKKGFTLIELSLAIAFIGILSLAVALIITNIISAYRRGLTLNQVNTVGAAVVEDLRIAIKESPVRSAVGVCDDFYNGKNDYSQTSNCERDEAMNLISVAVKANVQVGVRMINVPIYGAICTGNYSYVWNSGYFFNSDYKVSDGNIEAAIFSYNNGKTNVNISDFKLLKVKDGRRVVCQSLNSKAHYGLDIVKSGNHPVFSVGYLEEEPRDILKNSSFEVENNLAVYYLNTAVPVVNEKAHNSLYKVSMILGTVQGGINVASKGNFCTTPEDYQNDSVENFDYCSINKFNFAIQANGG